MAYPGLVNKTDISFMVMLFPSVTISCALIFHKEFDELTSENLTESQPMSSLNVDALESNVQDPRTDLGDHGMSLLQTLNCVPG